MDDIIVIILMVIVTVVGAVGRINKKKRPQPQPKAEGNTQNSSDDFWDFLENHEGQAPQPATQFTDTKTEPKTEPEKQEVRPKYTFSAENEGQNFIPRDDTVVDGIKNSVKEKKGEKISDTFSLRKAVIYSEILNRKYT